MHISTYVGMRVCLDPVTVSKCVYTDTCMRCEHVRTYVRTLAYSICVCVCQQLLLALQCRCTMYVHVLCRGILRC